MLAQKAYSSLVRDLTEKSPSGSTTLKNLLRTDDPEQKLCVALASSGVPYDVANSIINFIFYEIPSTAFLASASTNETEQNVFHGDTYESARAVAQWHLQAIGMAASSWDFKFNAAYEAAWHNWDALCTVVREAAHFAALVAMHGWKSIFAENAARDAQLKAMYLLLDFSEKSEYQVYVDERWDAWSRGLGVLCDVDGVLIKFVGAQQS